MIDDIYTSQRRIAQSGFSLRLIDLIRWRNIETVLADLLATRVVPQEYWPTNPDEVFSDPFARSPVIAIRHPRIMLHKLLDAHRLPRVYLSYPISRPRSIADQTGSRAAIDEINAFRKFFHEELVCFDPVTIDERPLKIIADRYTRSKEETLLTLGKELLRIDRAEPDAVCQIAELMDLWSEYRSATDDIGRNQTRNRMRASVSKALPAVQAYFEGIVEPRVLSKDNSVFLRPADRWPTPDDGTLDDTLAEPDGEIKTKLDIVDLLSVTAESINQQCEIDRQIRWRDFRLIDQSDYVIVYRPTYRRDRWSSGTAAEVRYAAENRGKSVFVIRDAEKDGPLASPPFEGRELPPISTHEGTGLAEVEGRVELFPNVLNAVRNIHPK